MAKEFNQVYKSLIIDHYSKEEFAILPILLNNGMSIKATPLPVKEGGFIFKVQRLKRTKPKEVTLGSSIADGTRLYDSFSNIVWETIEVPATKTYAIGLKFSVGYDLNIDWGNSTTMFELNQIVYGTTKKRVEDAIGAIIDGTPSNKPISDVYDDIIEDMNTISEIVDDYKDGVDYSNLVILASPQICSALAKIKGTIYRNEMPIFNTGFTPRQNVEGVPVLRVTALNKFKLANKRLGYIVMDKDALVYAYKGTELIKKDWGVSTYVGRVFYDYLKQIDKSRIRVGLTNKTTTIPRTTA